MYNNTLVERILRYFFNHKFFAPMIAAVIVITAIMSFLSIFTPVMERINLNSLQGKTVQNGWIFLGYRDIRNIVYWKEGPYAEVLGNSYRDAVNPFDVGNRIVLTKDREVVIIDYKVQGAKNVYIAPPKLHSILKPEDFTGHVIKEGTELIIRDLWMGGFPGKDQVVWVRVVPASSAT